MPTTSSSCRVKHPSPTSTTAGRPGPRRSRRPRTVAEKQFCALGPASVAFITGAAAAPHTRLGPELAELNTLTAAHGEATFVAALERATALRRWRAVDVRSTVAAGAGTPQPRTAGDALVINLPVSQGRPMSEYAPRTLPPPTISNPTAPASASASTPTSELRSEVPS